MPNVKKDFSICRQAVAQKTGGGICTCFTGLGNAVAFPVCSG